MDRDIRRIMCLGGLVGIVVFGVGPVLAQAPAEPASAQPLCSRRGRIHRMFHHVGHTAQDKFVGYPETFIEPPLGYYSTSSSAVQVAKADTHRFTLYRSDFLPGTTLFSPSGASRFNIMSTRIPGWMGPITVEWTPDAARAGRTAPPSLARRRCSRRAGPSWPIAS